MTFDRLDLLQWDASTSVAQIVDHVGLSQTPMLEAHPEAGGSGCDPCPWALLNPDAFGLSLTAFVMVKAVEHTAEWRVNILSVIEKLEPIRDIYRLAGN